MRKAPLLRKSYHYEHLVNMDTPQLFLPLRGLFHREVPIGPTLGWASSLVVFHSAVFFMSTPPSSLMLACEVVPTGQDTMKTKVRTTVIVTCILQAAI